MAEDGPDGTRARLRSVLSELPRHDEPGFTIRAVAALRDVQTAGPDEAITELEALLAEGRDPLAFTAWYLLIWRHRRFRDLRRVDELVREHFDAYADRPVAMLMRAEMLFRHPFEGGGCEEGLELCDRAIARVGKHLALAHQLRGQLLLGRARESPDGDQRMRMLSMARVSLMLGIEMRTHDSGRGYRDGRARHRLAEVLMEMGHFDLAAEHIEQAIDVEESSTPDYPVRLSEYQATRNEIQSRRLLARLEHEVAQHAGTVTEMRTQFIEIVGLIGLVIAFLASSTNLVAGGQVDRPISMFMGIGGVLTVVFAAFRLLFASNHRSGAERAIPAVAALVLGVGLLVGAWFLPA